MKIKSMILVALFASITAVFSIIPGIPLPFSPVPITLQVFAVLLSGAMLGPKLGALSQVVYLLLGVIGLPVFSGGAAGLSVLVGATGGYLIGFPLASFVFGYFLTQKKSMFGVNTIIAVLLSLAIIYIPGTLWLGHTLSLSLTKAFTIGSLPYIPLDLVKAVLVLLLAAPVRKRLQSAKLIN